MAAEPPPTPAPAFLRAAEDVRALAFRDDLVVDEIPAPQGLAPEALALAGDVRPDRATGESAYGTGRFILLHDAAAPDPWGGPFRVVTFAQAPLEPEIGTDPLLADVAWSWLVDALRSRGALFSAAAGTATKTVSKGFGSLEPEGEGAQIELRASWSPEGPIGPHVDAWAEFVCMLAGLPPGSEGVAVLGARKAARD
ncbi:MAG: DUF3000 domain-containing protein [Microbacterium sp.]|uniref:DUF3000 domain-containing protein n=1 Tax=Microbacterium sp. TaxID=51671 RepID=UPI0039E429DA